MIRSVAFGALVLASASACGERADAAARRERDAELDVRALQFDVRHADTSTRQGPLARWVLPPSLGEISGIALMADGRLLAHDDERSRVSVLDPRRGVVQKEFFVGSRSTKGDFEGITVAGTTIYLLTSRGEIYSFTEGAPGADVRYTMHDTRLGRECEFEGVAYDSTAAQLVLPCKRASGGGAALRDRLVIYRVQLPLTRRPAVSRLTIPMRAFRQSHPWRQLHPTDIARDPATGHFVMVTALERALIEITPDGGVIRAVPLPAGHAQPEGVAITSDGVLIVSDEARARAATITLYRWPPATATASRS